MPDAPSKLCKRCGAVKPLTEFYVDRSKGRPKSQCKLCTRALLKASDVTRAARRRAEKAGARPETAVLLQAGPPALPQPSPESRFRRKLVAAAERQVDKLVNKTLDLALAGDKAMMKLVWEHVIGPPQPQREHHGPDALYLRLWQRRQELLSGAGADVGVAAGDLAAGGLYAEPPGGADPPGAVAPADHDPAGGDDAAQGGEWGHPGGQIHVHGGGDFEPAPVA